VTVAVGKRDATALLSADRGQIRVQSRGSRREFELVALLRRAGKRFAKLTVERGSVLDGATIDVGIQGHTEDVAIAAIKRSTVAADRDGRQRWGFSPAASTRVTAGDELFAIGTPTALDQFATRIRTSESTGETAVVRDD
jgi:uncharacterized protein with PhoU and TrkA domain